MSKKFKVEERHKKVSGSNSERATSIRAAKIKLHIFKYKLADSAVGVTPGRYIKPIKHLLYLFQPELQYLAEEDHRRILPRRLLSHEDHLGQVHPVLCQPVRHHFEHQVLSYSCSDLLISLGIVLLQVVDKLVIQPVFSALQYLHPRRICVSVPFWLTLSEVVKVIWWIVLCQELLSIPAYKLQHFLSLSTSNDIYWTTYQLNLLLKLQNQSWRISMIARRILLVTSDPMAGLWLTAENIEMKLAFRSTQSPVDSVDIYSSRNTHGLAEALPNFVFQPGCQEHRPLGYVERSTKNVSFVFLHVLGNLVHGQEHLSVLVCH